MQNFAGTLQAKQIARLIQHAYGGIAHGAMDGARKRNAGALIPKKTALMPILPRTWAAGGNLIHLLDGAVKQAVGILAGETNQHAKILL